MLRLALKESFVDLRFPTTIITKTNVVEMFNQASVNDSAAEKLDAVFTSKSDSALVHETCNKVQIGNSFHQAIERSEASSNQEKVEQCHDRFSDSHQDSDRKRNNDEALPAQKKLYVDGFTSHKSEKEVTSTLKKVDDVEDNVKDVDPKCDYEKYFEDKYITR